MFAAFPAFDCGAAAFNGTQLVIPNMKDIKSGAGTLWVPPHSKNSISQLPVKQRFNGCVIG